MGHVTFSVVGLASSVIKTKGEEIYHLLVQRLLVRDSGVISAFFDCAKTRATDWLFLAGSSLETIEANLTVAPNAEPGEQMNALGAFIVDQGLSFAVETCIYCGLEVARTVLVYNVLPDFGDTLKDIATELTRKYSTPYGWVVVIAEAVNDTLPLTVSLLTPTNGMAGNDLEWTGTQLTGATRNDARPNGSGVPGSVSPRAYFSYSQGPGAYIGFDASESEFDFVPGFEWDFGDGSFPGSGMTTSHTYAGPGTRTVKLVVTDGAGNKAETTRRVEVADGRAPQIQSLTCTADPTNPLRVLMDFTVFDEDADLKQLEWYLDANADSPEKTTPIDVVWDTWTSSESLLYSDDGVQVYAPALVVYDAGGNKAAAVCKPVSAIKVGSYPLNDTGITTCSTADTNGLSCPQSGFPGQDAESGRDVTHNDPSDGHAGFSFTKLDANGNPLPANAAAWSCVRDNVTGRVWEVKIDDGGLRDKDWTYSWYNPETSTNGGSAGYADYGNNCFDPTRCDTDKFVADVNTQGLCGKRDWRLPSQVELLSIVSNNRYNPAIDAAWFPNTPSSWFWSSSPDANYPNHAWNVNFNNGNVNYGNKLNAYYVRLVRGGQ